MERIMNDMAKDPEDRCANGMSEKWGAGAPKNNGAPSGGTHVNGYMVQMVPMGRTRWMGRNK